MFAERSGSLIPSKKTEPFSIAKAEPFGPTGVVGGVQRVRSTQLGTRFFRVE